MLTPQISIIPAQVEHASALAKIHVESWRETYTGQMPQQLLDQLDISKRTTMWEQIISSSKSWEGVFLALDNGIPVGFVSFGKARGSELPEHGEDDGEVYALYLLRAYQGRGIGWALWQKATTSLRLSGANQVYIWVLDTNQVAIDFYVRVGAAAHGIRRTENIAGASLVELLMVAPAEVATEKI